MHINYTWLCSLFHSLAPQISIAWLPHYFRTPSYFHFFPHQLIFFGSAKNASCGVASWSFEPVANLENEVISVQSLSSVLRLTNN